MRLLKRFCVLIPGLAMALAMSPVVRADAVTDWNAIAIQTIAAQASHPGATSFLDSAIVQAAVYDAVESITGRFRPYAVHVPGASGSTAAAVAKAAHDVLVSRFPSASVIASLDTTYHNYLALTVFRRAILVSPSERRLRPVSSRCARMTGAFRTAAQCHRLRYAVSSAAPTSASGARRPPFSPDRHRPIRQC